MGLSKSKLSKKTVAKIAEETQFSEEEIRHWHKGFLKDCPNGKLKRDDFVKIYAQFFPTGNSFKFAKIVFQAFDSDKSGSIDFDEFLTALSVTSKGETDKKLDWAFKLYDLDGNGSVDLKEMTEIVGAILSMTNSSDVDKEAQRRAQNIFKQFDKDGNGLLSRDEFLEGAMKDKTILKALSIC